MSRLRVHQTLWILWVGGHGRRGFPKSIQKPIVFEHPSFYRCHVFKNNCKTQWKSLVFQLACVLAMWQIVVFSSCNLLHILPMYFEHVVSFRFGIQATLGLYASLSSVLQAALGHETTVCVTFGARWRDTYFC